MADFTTVSYKKGANAPAETNPELDCFWDVLALTRNAKDLELFDLSNWLQDFSANGASYLWFVEDHPKGKRGHGRIAFLEPYNKETVEKSIFQNADIPSTILILVYRTKKENRPEMEKLKLEPKRERKDTMTQNEDQFKEKYYDLLVFCKLEDEQEKLKELENAKALLENKFLREFAADGTAYSVWIEKAERGNRIHARVVFPHAYSKLTVETCLKEELQLPDTFPPVKVYLTARKYRPDSKNL